MNKLAFLSAIFFLINIVSSAQLSPSEQSNIRVAVDGDSPIISIMSPKNITYGNATILINYTISDITIDSAWYSLNNKENTADTEKSLGSSLGASLGANVLNSGSFLPVNIFGWLLLIILTLVLVLLGQHLYSKFTEKKEEKHL